MSAYWAAYHGEGLVLTPDEFERFLKNYQERHEQDTGLVKQIEEYLGGGIGINEITFRSRQGNPFSIFYVSEDIAEGFRLFPYRIAGRPNTEWKQNEHMSSNSVYVVSADKPINGMSCFEEKPYASYRDFVEEFTDKMDGCLKEGFDWDSHIGIYSYAAFA